MLINDEGTGEDDADDVEDEKNLEGSIAGLTGGDGENDSGGNDLEIELETRLS